LSNKGINGYRNFKEDKPIGRISVFFCLGGLEVGWWDLIKKLLVKIRFKVELNQGSFELI
jgi:hypothetical protein